MHPFFIASVLLIVSVNYVVIYLFEVEKFGLLISAQILVIIIAILFFSSVCCSQQLHFTILLMMWSATNSILALTTRIFRALRLQPLSSRYDRSYCNFLFLWLILTSVIPTYYIYKLSYAEETEDWMRYLQLTAARNVRVARAFSDPPMNLVAAQAATLGVRWTRGRALHPVARSRLQGADPGRAREGRAHHPARRRPAAGGPVELAEIYSSDTFVHVTTAVGELVAQLTGVHRFDLGAPITLHLTRRRSTSSMRPVPCWWRRRAEGP